MKKIFLFLFSLSIAGFAFASFQKDRKSSLLFEQSVQKAHILPSYAYPYTDLPHILSKAKKNSLTLFSYGSLMDARSAGRTLSPEAMESRRPGLAFGIKRAFDRDVPIKPESRWGIPCDPMARGMLNIQPADKREDFVNGVLVDVPLEDLPKLLEREEGYDLIPVVVTEWKTYLKGTPEFTIAYTLHASAESKYTNNAIYPRPGYYELTRDASSQFGPLFHFLWMGSTYLANGKTSILLWEAGVKQKQSHTSACS